jgi:hypothetical protein
MHEGIDTVRFPTVWSNLEPRAPDGDGSHYLSWGPSFRHVLGRPRSPLSSFAYGVSAGVDRAVESCDCSSAATRRWRAPGPVRPSLA